MSDSFLAYSPGLSFSYGIMNTIIAFHCGLSYSYMTNYQLVSFLVIHCPSYRQFIYLDHLYPSGSRRGPRLYGSPFEFIIAGKP